MIRTPADRADGFVVREATPERIARLYRSDQLAQLSKQQRENGLIFAGRGDLLKFEAPSDIVRAIDRWFPQEMAQARSEKRLSRDSVRLHGPFANWEDEPAAFVTLWHCMPRRAWLHPDKSPYDADADAGGGYVGAATHSSNNIDFGQCVRNYSGWEMDYSRSPQDRFAMARRDMATRTVPLLVGHFARHLAKRGCGGTGPDDCALIALLWSSLTPADPALAAALQKISPKVLAAAQVDAPDSEAGRRQRLQHGLRQAALLRAQLTSLSAAPSAWPADALPQALQQLATLQTELDRARWDANRNWSRYELHYYNEPINPWPLLDTVAQQPAGLAALRAQITALPRPVNLNCQVYEPWTKRMPQAVLAGLALDTWRAGRSSLCVLPDWNWLRGELTPEARQVYAALLALLPKAPGQVHEQVLSGLTNDGSDCFEDSLPHASKELQAVCRAWISEPGKVDEPLAHAGRSVQPADRFATLTLPETPAELLESRPEAQTQRNAWLGAQLKSLGAPEGDIRTMFAALQRAGQQIVGLRGWRRADAQQHLIELDWVAPEPVAGEPPAEATFPFGGQRVMLLIGSGKAQLVGSPGRLAFQYDEGSISQVTDIDHDGRPEAWLSGVSGECDGEDLKPGADCAFPEVHMGEVWGDMLSYFAWTPGSAGADATVKETRP